MGGGLLLQNLKINTTNQIKLLTKKDSHTWIIVAYFQLLNTNWKQKQHSLHTALKFYLLPAFLCRARRQRREMMTRMTMTPVSAMITRNHHSVWNGLAICATATHTKARKLWGWEYFCVHMHTEDNHKVAVHQYNLHNLQLATEVAVLQYNLHNLQLATEARVFQYNLQNLQLGTKAAMFQYNLHNL